MKNNVPNGGILEVKLTPAQAAMERPSCDISAVAERVSAAVGDRINGEVYLVFPNSSDSGGQAASWFTNRDYGEPLILQLNATLRSEYGFDEVWGRFSSGSERQAVIQIGFKKKPVQKPSEFHRTDDSSSTGHATAEDSRPWWRRSYFR